MNHVNLIGRVTRDVEVRYTQDNTAVARFTLAVDRRKKDEADFISCIAFGKTAELIGKYISKGRQVGVGGRIQTGSYTNREGQKVYTTDVVVDDVTFIGSKEEPKEGVKEAKPDKDGFLEMPDGLDEELPFL